MTLFLTPFDNKKKLFFFLLFALVGLHMFGQKESRSKVPCSMMASKFLIKGIDTSYKRGMADNYFLWNSGTVLTVKFMNSGSNKMRQKVIYFAKQWENYANIKFEFVPDRTYITNIRVRLGQGKGHNSYVGTQNIHVPPFEETLNLDTSDFIGNDAWMRSVVLHEFGHALGLLHEQSYPDAIQWNKDTIYKYFSKSQVPPWTKEQVDQNVFFVYDRFYTNGTKYDPYSIMHYWLDSWETVDSFYVLPNYDLSEGDKSLISKLYPNDRKNSVLEVPRILVSNASLNVYHNPKKKGLSIYPSFDVQTNSILGQVFLVAKIVDQNNNYVTDNNELYNWGGYVATYTKINLLPDSKISFNTNNSKEVELFLPYSEIPIKKGKKVTIEFSIVLNDIVNNQFEKLMYYNVTSPFKINK